MNAKRESSRRDFLKGRSAADALQDLVEGKLPDPAGSPQSGKPPSLLMQISRRAMAVDFQIYLNAGQYPLGAEKAMEALDLVESLEAQLTIYRETSEVMAINQAAATKPVTISRPLFRLIQQAVQLGRETDAALDITSGPLSKVWGFYRRAGKFPGEDDVQAALEDVGLDNLELNESASTIHFRKPRTEINLNAIGKGYALDRCGDLLLSEEVESFLIHGGQSSVLAAGSRLGMEAERQGWPVALRHPLRPEVRLAEVQLHDQALGTSGSGVQFFYHRGRRYGHVLDPRTGWPAEGVLSATVLAPTAALADALSTAFYVMGIAHVEEYCTNHPELAAILVCPGKRRGSITLHTFGLDSTQWRRVDDEPAAE